MKNFALKLGPTNRSSLLDSSPFSETANANLLNPKSPSNDLKNRSTIRLPSRNNTNTSSSSLTVHNNQTASNLNNVNNNNSNNNLLISQSSNSSQLARINASSSSNRSSSTTKNTSPPVKPVQASSKPISHSASTPSLPVNKPSKKSDTDLFKVFKVNNFFLLTKFFSFFNYFVIANAAEAFHKPSWRHPQWYTRWIQQTQTSNFDDSNKQPNI